MSDALLRLAARARRTGFVQATRLVEQVARRRRGRPIAGVGEDAAADEPVRFEASGRMALPVGDLSEVRLTGDRATIVANVMGLIGSTPVLPSYYSEMQLRRRRLRDLSMANFYNIFDHRALSFFYRVARKYNWLLGHERTGGGPDPVSGALLAYAGLPNRPTRDRLAFADVALAPLAGHLGGTRHSANALGVVLRQVTGLALRVHEVVPVWLPLPPGEQTRIGGPARRLSARLGGGADAALVGASVLDVQHHFEVAVGPLDRGAFLAFVGGDEMLGRIRDVCRLMAGIEHRPSVRLLIARDEAPPMRLSGEGARLSRTAWLGRLDGRGAVLADCVIPIR